MRTLRAPTAIGALDLADDMKKSAVGSRPIPVRPATLNALGYGRLAAVRYVPKQGEGTTHE